MNSTANHEWARLVRASRVRASSASGGEDTADSLLLLWLAAIGWTPEIERDGDIFVGVARHPFAGTVSACARTRAETVWQLFQDVIAKIEAGRPVTDLATRRRPLAA